MPIPFISAAASGPLLSDETRQLFADREQHWQRMSERERAAWAVERRRAWRGCHPEPSHWLPMPLTLGQRRGVPEHVVVALGVNSSGGPGTLADLIIDQRGHVGHMPVLLGWMLARAPFYEVDFEPAALQLLALTYGLLMPPLTDRPE